MTNTARVTIAKDLTVDDVSGLSDFPFNAVIDLRRDERFGARPVNERLVKRLGNFFVDFNQIPVDVTIEAFTEELLAHVVRHDGDLLVLTDQIAEFRTLCDRNHLESHVFNAASSRRSVVSKQAESACMAHQAA